MKETLDNIISFLKGLAQPGITVMAIIVFLGYAGSGKFTPDQVWTVVVGIIVFWFGYTAFKFGTGKDESPKADSLIGTPNKVSGWGDCGDYDYGNETVNSGFSPADNASEGKVEEIINGIFADLKADGIKADVAAVSSRIVSYLGAHGDELDPDDLADLITAGINYASTAYKDVTGLTPPTDYSQVADYNKWWRQKQNQKACKAPKGEARAVLMVLRDLLKRLDDL